MHSMQGMFASSMYLSGWAAWSSAGRTGLTVAGKALRGTDVGNERHFPIR